MKYLVVEYRYGYKPVSFDNQVRPLEGINICAETHDSNLQSGLQNSIAKSAIIIISKFRQFLKTGI